MRKLIITFTAFCRGVGGYLLKSFRELSRTLWRYEQSSEHVVKRVIEVESRIESPQKRLKFLYRWARYLIHHYHLMPNWLKLAKLVLIILLIFGPGLWESFQREHRQKEIYSDLYNYYYQHYIKQQQSEQSARYYAGLYAQRYAEYYTSEAYQEALRYALPEQVLQTPQKTIAEVAPETEEKRKAKPSIPDSKPETAKPPAQLAAKDMQPVLLPIGVELIKHFEGLMLKPYKDAGGKYTIGYGHLMRPTMRVTQITEEKAEQLLQKDLYIAQSIIRERVKVPLTPYQFSALVSLVYNIGGYQFRTSTLLKKLNRGDYDGAAKEILRWNKVGRKTLRGLKRRRQAEYRLFTGKWKQPQAALAPRKFFVYISTHDTTLRT